MQFTDYSMIADYFDYFQSQKKANCDFNEVAMATDDFDEYLLAHAKGIDMSIIDEIRSKALSLGCAYERQGFIYGMSKGIAIVEQAISLNERK